MTDTARMKCEGYGRFCWRLDNVLAAFSTLSHGIGVASWERRDGSSRPRAGVALHAKKGVRYEITYCPFCAGPVSEAWPDAPVQQEGGNDVDA